MYPEENNMDTATKSQRTITDISEDSHLRTWINGYMLDRNVQGFSQGTLDFYHKKLTIFTEFCESQIITSIDQLTPNIIRLYLLWPEERGHNGFADRVYS